MGRKRTTLLCVRLGLSVCTAGAVLASLARGIRYTVELGDS